MPQKSVKTVLELPSRDSYWTPRRKPAVIGAVRGGRIPSEEGVAPLSSFSR